jgi:hypothetical protein
MGIDDMLSRYSVSWFADTTAAGWFDANEAAKQSGDDSRTIDARAVGGLSVPLAKGRELVTALIENVEDARDALRGTAERLQRAKRDGLLDMDGFKQQDGETQERWLACVQVVRGDYGRAMSELRHWQEYAELATKGELPTLKDATGSGTELIRMLADSKAIDRRLPPEHDIEAAQL